MPQPTNQGHVPLTTDQVQRLFESVTDRPVESTNPSDPVADPTPQAPSQLLNFCDEAVVLTAEVLARHIKAHANVGLLEAFVGFDDETLVELVETYVPIADELDPDGNRLARLGYTLGLIVGARHAQTIHTITGGAR